MGRFYHDWLPNWQSLYRCGECRSHLALSSDLEADTFRSGPHRAFLFTHVINVRFAPHSDRHLTTGLHTVADLFCGDCGSEIGWMYVKAFEPSQKYKENKFILVENKIVKEECPHPISHSDNDGGGPGGRLGVMTSGSSDSEDDASVRQMSDVSPHGIHPLLSSPTTTSSRAPSLIAVIRERAQARISSLAGQPR